MGRGKVEFASQKKSKSDDEGTLICNGKYSMSEVKLLAFFSLFFPFFVLGFWNNNFGGRSEI